ncbi:MAG: hypothetical protein JWM33_345 [Caulobacteraceae bacterium]|nr:hypothetical protein [Caulobacteraceae bacterium]
MPQDRFPTWPHWVGEPTRERYEILPDQDGWSVYDAWKDGIVLLAKAPQTGMTKYDAQALAAMLNYQENHCGHPLTDGE